MNLYRRLVQCLGLSLALIFLTACTGASSVYPTQTGAEDTPNSARSQEEWKAYIVDAFRAQAEQPWRSESETVFDGDRKGSTTIEHVPPDRYRISSLPDMEMILIGDVVFAKLNQVWTVVNIPAASVIDPDNLTRLERSIRNVQCTGPETLNGKTMNVCEYTQVVKVGGTEMEAQSKLWIDADTNLPYQSIIEGPVGILDSSTGEILPRQAVSTTVYTVDPQIQIVAPQIPQ